MCVLKNILWPRGSGMAKVETEEPGGAPEVVQARLKGVGAGRMRLRWREAVHLEGYIEDTMDS